MAMELSHLVMEASPKFARQSAKLPVRKLIYGHVSAHGPTLILFVHYILESKARSYSDTSWYQLVLDYR